MASYPVPTKTVEAAMNAKSTLNIFAGIEALLEGGVISGENAAARKIIFICKTEAQRQLRLMDKAVGQINKDVP
jgi:hypothetical protein